MHLSGGGVWLTSGRMLDMLWSTTVEQFDCSPGKSSGHVVGDTFAKVPSLTAVVVRRIVDSVTHGRAPESPLNAGEFLFFLDGKSTVSDVVAKAMIG